MICTRILASIALVVHFGAKIASAGCSITEDGVCYCTDLTVIDVKADTSKILVLYKKANGDLGGWHLLAPYSHASANPKLSIALTAKVTGSKATMSFSSTGGDCDSGNNVPSIAFEIQDN